MRDYYEVLGVASNVSGDEIRKQYRVLALKFHPDRNIGKEVEAAELFKEVQTAYEVLSDSRERRWYDDHKESILRGKNHEEDDEDVDPRQPPEEMNLWKFYNSNLYHNPNEFFEVYSRCFDDIYALELESELGINLPLAPSIGNMRSTDAEVITFYNFWTNFVSVLSCSFADKYNPNEAPNRDVRRLIEKDNKKERDAARKKYVDQVRSLALFVKKRDVRIIEMENNNALKQQQEAERKKALKEEAQEKRRQTRLQYAEDEEEINRRKEEISGAFLLASEQDPLDDNGKRKKKRNKQVKINLSASSSSKGNNDMDELSQQFDAMLSNRANPSSNNNNNAAFSDPADDMENKSKPIATTTTTTTTATTLNPVNENTEGGEEDEEEGGGGESVAFHCEVCSKYFKSEPQLLQHLGNRVHLKKEKEALRAASKKK